MNEIIEKKQLAQNIILIEVVSPWIAKKSLPGQFVIVRAHSKGERIPLTVVKTNWNNNSITLIFQIIGKTTKLLSELKIGDSIPDLAGPLGCPTELKHYGSVIVIGGGVGIAEVLPVATGLKKFNNKITTIIGSRTKELIILEKELQSFSDELYITTDDGSYGQKGFVTDVLTQLLTSSPPHLIALVYAVGPVVMMKKVCEITQPYNIKTVVSLNPIMLDGTGMCGSCRVTINGETKFACVDGPEFDGHKVDWQELEARLKLFKEQERVSLNI